jgi:hypothetical protein
MLTLQDCVDYSDLTEDVVRAIAIHEHVPNIVALEIGANLIKTPAGCEVIEGFIREEIDAAHRQHRAGAREYWRAVLARFRARRPP